MVLNRDAILRLIVATHFVCTSMVLMVGWLPESYVISQITIIVLGLWAIVHRDSVIQIELLMVIKAFSIILDIIAISMYFKMSKDSYSLGYLRYFPVSAFFTLLLLFLKPPMLILLNKVRQERLGGEASPTFGKWGLGAGPWGLSTGYVVPGYQPVDEQPIPRNNV